MDQDATWYHEDRPPPRPHCSRWGPRSPSKKRGAEPRFSAHVGCGQRAEWIKMPLGTKVGRGPGHIVLHGNPAPLQKRGTAPSFRPMSIVAKLSPVSSTAGRLLRYVSVQTDRQTVGQAYIQTRSSQYFAPLSGAKQLWPPDRAVHNFFVLWFLRSSSSFFFPRLFSAIGDWMSNILPHMMWP